MLKTIEVVAATVMAVLALGGPIFWIIRSISTMQTKIEQINKAVNHAKEGEKTLREYVMDIHSEQKVYGEATQIISHNRDDIKRIVSVMGELKGESNSFLQSKLKD